MGCEKQNQAFIYLFLAIYEENGYYDNLRNMAKVKGYNPADMAHMLYTHYDDAPDGMSPYWYMDSLEDVLGGMSKKEIKSLSGIGELVEITYDKFAWKE